MLPISHEKDSKLQHSTLSNSGTTITNSAPNGFGSGLANQHRVLHVIIIKQKSEFFKLKRHATFHKKNSEQN